MYKLYDFIHNPKIIVVFFIGLIIFMGGEYLLDSIIFKNPNSNYYKKKQNLINVYVTMITRLKFLLIDEYNDKFKKIFSFKGDTYEHHLKVESAAREYITRFNRIIGLKNILVKLKMLI